MDATSETKSLQEQIDKLKASNKQLEREMSDILPTSKYSKKHKKKTKLSDEK